MKRFIIYLWIGLLGLPLVCLAARPKMNKAVLQLHGDMQYKTVHYNKYLAIQIDEDPPLFPVNYEVDLGDLKLKTPQDLAQFQEGFAVLTAAQFDSLVPETFPNSGGRTWAAYIRYWTCGTYYLIKLDRGGFGSTGTCRQNPPTPQEMAGYLTTFNVDYLIPKLQGLELINTGVCVP